MEHFLGETAGIFLRLYHQRRHSADQRCLRDSALAMSRQIMRHLSTAGGVADMHGVLESWMRGQRREIVSIVIHVVAAAGLARATMTAPVMGNDPITGI